MLNRCIICTAHDTNPRLVGAFRETPLHYLHYANAQRSYEIHTSDQQRHKNDPTCCN